MGLENNQQQQEHQSHSEDNVKQELGNIVSDIQRKRDCAGRSSTVIINNTNDEEQQQEQQQQSRSEEGTVKQELGNVVSDIQRKQDCAGGSRTATAHSKKDAKVDYYDEEEQQPPYFGDEDAVQGELQNVVSDIHRKGRSTKGVGAVRVAVAAPPLLQRNSNNNNSSLDQDNKVQQAIQSSQDFCPGAMHHAPGQSPTRARPFDLTSLSNRVFGGGRSTGSTTAATSTADDADHGRVGVHKEVDGELIDFTSNSSGRIMEEEEDRNSPLYKRMNMFKYRNESLASRLTQKKHRRWLFCIVVGVVAVLVVSIVVGVVVGTRKGQPSTPQPALDRDSADDDDAVNYVETVDDCLTGEDYVVSELFMRIQSTIVSELPEFFDAIESPGTAARASLCWLADLDRFFHSGNDVQESAMIQRFTMGLIYFHFVLDLEADSDSKLPTSNWLHEVHECYWDHVECNDAGEVVVLYMPRLDLGGIIPSELSLLKKLSTLELEANLLVGSIPSEIWTMESLETLNVKRNFLTGTVSEIRNLPQLQNFHASANIFTGSMPDFKGLPNLKRLEFAINNELTGMFPNLEGTTNLEMLLLGTISLWGTIPTYLGSLTKLTHLSLSQLGDFEGSIPTEIGMLTDLRVLTLNSLSFISGTIPTELGQLTRLEILSLDNLKKLTGTMPSEIGRLTNLALLDLSFTEGLIGSIPAEVCDLRSRNLGTLVPPCFSCETTCPAGV